MTDPGDRQRPGRRDLQRHQGARAARGDAGALPGERRHGGHRCAGRGLGAPAAGGRTFTGRGADTDTLVASAKAYLSALNKLSARRDRLHAQAAQSGVSHRASRTLSQSGEGGPEAMPGEGDAAIALGLDAHGQPLIRRTAATPCPLWEKAAPLSQSTRSLRRAPLRAPAVIDAARGLAVLAMVVYHFSWDLRYFGYIAAGCGRRRSAGASSPT